MKRVTIPEIPKDSISVDDASIDYRLIVAYDNGDYPSFHTFVYSGYEQWVWSTPNQESHCAGVSDSFEHTSESTGREGLREEILFLTRNDPQNWEIVQYNTLEEKYEGMLKFIKKHKLGIS